ncbi:MAG: 2-hydroxyglutaryl-CoA dehydratase [Proteobacteria bacterium]|nr:2-hydroxyglutaryl-CoA dehydratase [Pseudomonadota bacterium]
MITAGIDIGHQTANAVLLEEGRVLGHETRVVSGAVEAAARMILDRLIESSGVLPSDIERIFATGVGRENVGFVQGHPTGMLCHVRGAHHLFPEARTVIDVGAEGSRILLCDERGNLVNFVMNDKCASGAGVFLETVAEMMGITLSEMGPLSLDSSGSVVLTTTCAVFAESEIVAEIHRGSPRQDILWGVHDSIAIKIVQTSNRTVLEREIVLTGGVARNIGVVKAMEKQLGYALLVPERPEIVGALGAALLAAEGKEYHDQTSTD